MQEIWVQSLSQKDLREKEMATQSSIFAWENPIDRGSWQATVHGVAYGTIFLQRIALKRTLHSTLPCLVALSFICIMHSFEARESQYLAKKNNKLRERNLLTVSLLYSQVNFYCPLSFISNMNHSALLASNLHAC